MFNFYFQKLQFQHVNTICMSSREHMFPGVQYSCCLLQLLLRTSEPMHHCNVISHVIFLKEKYIMKKKENKFDHWALQLDVLVHFHILALKAEGHELIQKARCADGVLILCLPIPLISHFQLFK